MTAPISTTGSTTARYATMRDSTLQIVVGLIADASGFPLEVTSFEENRAETVTTLPVIRRFMTAHRLTDVTVEADAGMVSDANTKVLEGGGPSFIIGARVPKMPSVVQWWKDAHPGAEIGDGQVFTRPWHAGPTDGRRDHAVYYQYRADRARRTQRGIDEQVNKAQQASAGKAVIKRNRFVSVTGSKQPRNRELEAKARALAWIKGYVT